MSICLSGEVGQVDDAVFDERATVVDAHRDGFAIGQIAHFDDRVERKGAMCRGHCVHIVSLTVGSSTPVIGMAIPRSIAGGLLGERSDRWLSGIGCVNSLPGTTADQESTTREKDRKDKVSMFHAALATWVSNRFAVSCGVLFR